jgi:peptide/nickel transport system substrate-binding protein
MKKNTHKNFAPRRALLSILVAGSLMGAAAPVFADKASDTLVFAASLEPENVSPYHNNAREGIILSRLAWDTLIYRDPKTSEYKPLLATTWKWEDPTHILLTLRKGVTFQNGDAFTADDVVFTFNYVNTPEAKVVTKQNVNWIDRAEKVDDFTVRVVLKQPFPAALEYLSGPTPIYPAKYFQQVGIDGYSKAPIGTGPYKITKVLSGEGVEMERNENYFEGGPIAKPAISKIKFQVITDPDARLAQLMTGGIDWTWRVPSDQADELRMMPNLEVVSSETMRVGYLAMDVASEQQKNSPFQNKLVREAVNYAINREGLANELVRGGSRPIYTPCFPTQFGCDTAAAKKYDYNPEKAKALLAEAGYPDGFETDFYAYREMDLAEAMLGDLRAVGIKVKLHMLTYAALRKEQRSGNVPIAFQTWGSYSVNDASAMISVYFKGGADDLSRDKRVISLLEVADSSVDPVIRKENYSAAIKIISEEAYWAPMFSYSSNYAFSNDLNFTAYPDELPRFVESSWK